MSQALQYFKELVAIDSSINDVYLYIYEHPLLFDTNNWAEFLDWIKTLNGEGQNRTFTIFKFLDGCYRKEAANACSNYPYGHGPIEKIVARLNADEISLTYAADLAKKAGPHISALYCQFLSYYAEDLAAARTKKTESPNVMHQLLMLAVTSNNGGDRFRCEFITFTSWLNIVTRSVTIIPDGMIFYDAVRKAELLLAQTYLSSVDRSFVLHALAILHHDPYFADVEILSFWTHYYRWQNILRTQFSVDDIRENKRTMPDPVAVLKAATGYARQAADFREGISRALSLKLYLDIQAALYFFNEPIDLPECTGLANEAINLVSGNQDYVNVEISLVNRLNLFKSVRDEDLIAIDERKITNYGPDQLNAIFGKEKALQIVTSISGNLSSFRPLRGLLLSLKYKSLIPENAIEELRIRYYNHNFSLLARCTFSTYFDLDEIDAENFARRFTELVATPERFFVSERAASLTLLQWAIASSTYNQESGGRKAIDKAIELNRILYAEYYEHIVFSIVQLYSNLAVDSIHERDWRNAISYYAAAFDGLLLISMPLQAGYVFLKFNDIIERSDVDMVALTIDLLKERSLLIENQLGGQAVGVLQQIYSLTLARTVGEGNLPGQTVLLNLMQLAKGFHFASILERSDNPDWSLDPELQDLLRKIYDLKIPVAGQGEVNTAEIQEDSLLTEEILLNAYVSEIERTSGNNDEKHLFNLQKKFDQLLHEKFAGNNPGLFTVTGLQALIPEKTVLLNYFWGTTTSGTLVLYTALLTNTLYTLFIRIFDMNAQTIKSSHESFYEITIHPYAPLIAHLRSAIQEFPGLGWASEEAESILKIHSEHFIDVNLDRELTKLNAQGKNHLLIIPHGPLHFYPFHLLGKNEILYADDWAITYLPNVQLLKFSTHKRGLAHKDVAPISCFGLVSNPLFQTIFPDLTDADQEALEIASVLGGNAFVNEQATKSQFLLALTSSSMLHLSCHGDHNVLSPSFQSLYLYPNKDNDGVVKAFELSALDLSNLDLITLSACETALGRFDLSDNIRGLPAFLLAAGAKTIIGTLWEIETTLSRFFFRQFYIKIKDGYSKIDSFRFAQIETRKEYPQYRDWGAFYLIGKWL